MWWSCDSHVGHHAVNMTVMWPYDSNVTVMRWSHDSNVMIMWHVYFTHLHQLVAMHSPVITRSRVKYTHKTLHRSHTSDSSVTIALICYRREEFHYHKLVSTPNAQFLTCRATSLKYLWVSQIFKTCIFGSRPLKFAVHNKEPWQCDFSAVERALQLTFIKLSDWSGLLSCTL